MNEKKKQIISIEDELNFHCHSGIACYTNCCADVNIFLTPYDVLRLRQRMRIPSEKFLKQYTVRLKGSNPLIPLVVLKMDESRENRCPFVAQSGCSVYEDRPWACRMFPLNEEIRGKYSFICDGTRCKGLLQERTWKVSEWLGEQGISEYESWNEQYETITCNPRLQGLDATNPQVERMIFMATYDLDAFRRFVFDTRFFEMFDIAWDRVEQLKTNEIELLKLGLEWVRFGLLGEKTLRVKEGVVDLKQKQSRGRDQIPI